MNRRILVIAVISATLNANFEFGADIQYSRYTEFDTSKNDNKIMEDKGPMAGIFLNFYTDLSQKWRLDSFARTLWGSLKYDGSYLRLNNDAQITHLSYDNNPFSVFDSETTLTYNSKKLGDIKPFIGLGIRRLVNYPEVASSYYRYDNYYYLPLGITKGDYKLTYRWLIIGDNQSILPSLNIEVKQHTGSGIYFSKNIHLSKKYQTQFYVEYWNIKDSTKQRELILDNNQVKEIHFFEPKNHTFTTGIKISSSLNL